jgi:hypothetical protein
MNTDTHGFVLQDILSVSISVHLWFKSKFSCVVLK